MNSIDKNVKLKNEETLKSFPKCIGINAHYELMKNSNLNLSKVTEETPSKTNYQELQGTHYWVG